MFKKFLGLDRDRRGYLRALCACALMIALSFLFDRILGEYISAGLPNWLALNISFVPIMFAGFLFGPLWGGIVGAAADIIGCVLVPLGPYHPGFTLTNFLVGFAAGVFVFAFPKLPYKIWGQALYCVPISAVASLLNSLWLSQMYSSKSFWGWVTVRFWPAMAASVVYVLLMYLLMRFCATALKKARLI